jgi:aryl-alcohol dehydrogenase-like predicted oxidoreductase
MSEERKSEMNYRFLGRTGLLVSELCLGTMTFGGEGFWKAIGTLGQKEVNELVARAIDAGVNFIDTADIYSYGESERLLGNAIKDRPRESLIIATKVRGRMSEGINDVGLTRHHIMSSVEQSLHRLGTDYIDLYQIHGFDPYTPMEETMHALDDLVAAGMVRYIGASNLAAWQLMKALDISEREGLARFQSIQSYYTIAGRELEREIIPAVQDQGVGVLVWSPLAGGLLSGKFRRDSESPEDARRSSFDFPPVDKEKVYRIVDVMDGIAANHGVSVARVALAWLLHQKAVTSVIIGAKKMDQLEDNLAGVSVRLTDEELKKLDEVSALAPEYPGWMLARQGEDRVPKG